MIKNWKITIAFLIGSIIVSYISALELNTIDSVAGKIGYIGGPSLFLFLFPLLLAYLLKVIFKLFRTDLTNNKFFAAYTVLWAIIVFLAIQGSIIQKNEKSQGIKNSGFLYKPKRSEFSIVFGLKPTITPTATTIGTNIVQGETAEVTSPNSGDLERVEFYLLDQAFLNSINKEFLYKSLNEYSLHNGLNAPEFKYYENKNEKHGELRAFKDFTDNNGKKGKLTFLVKVYIKGETYFTTFVGCESKDFPTKEIERFWNSLN